MGIPYEFVPLCGKGDPLKSQKNIQGIMPISFQSSFDMNFSPWSIRNKQHHPSVLRRSPWQIEKVKGIPPWWVKNPESLIDPPNHDDHLGRWDDEKKILL